MIKPLSPTKSHTSVYHQSSEAFIGTRMWFLRFPPLVRACAEPTPGRLYFLCNIEIFGPSPKSRKKGGPCRPPWAQAAGCPPPSSPPSQVPNPQRLHPSNSQSWGGGCSRPGCPGCRRTSSPPRTTAWQEKEGRGQAGLGLAEARRPAGERGSASRWPPSQTLSAAPQKQPGNVSNEFIRKLKPAA